MTALTQAEAYALFENDHQVLNGVSTVTLTKVSGTTLATVKMMITGYKKNRIGGSEFQKQTSDVQATIFDNTLGGNALSANDSVNDGTYNYRIMSTSQDKFKTQWLCELKRGSAT